MKCPSDGDLRALTAQGADAQVLGHVLTCASCQQRQESIKRSIEISHTTLEALGPTIHSDAVPDPANALLTFKASTRKTERTNTMTEFGKRNYRPAFVGGALLVALVLAMTIAPVRSAAVGLFDVFRVEKFAVITVDTSKMPMQMNSDTDHGRTGERPDPNVFGTYNGPLQPEKPQQVASVDAASEVVGSELAEVGNALAGKSQNAVYVSAPVRASYTFDTEKIAEKVRATGLEGIRVPQQIDGKTFMLSADRGVIVRYGTKDDSAVFAQGPSPELTIPDGVNMDYLRQDFLMIPGIPANVKEQVQAIEDWEKTLIIPVPANGTSREVKVDGHEGVLIGDATGENNGVLWQRDGKLYAIGGKMSGAQALEAARAVRYP
ncbi:MAG: hypothetical protein M3506_03390 [Chloroflexota bacterium]|nr:hypothetical protein [Chloroflexota bacterium]